MSKLVLPFLAITIAVVSYIYFKPPPTLPDLDYNKWWGPTEKQDRQDTSIRPFTFNFSETMIQDLKWRLQNHQPFTPPLEGVNFEYGFNSKTLLTWLDYWAEKYPFAERQTFLNQYPQFKTDIQGLDIHFIRVKPKVTPGIQAVPVLLCHGWPGSVREFYEAIPYLTAISKDRDFALELIIPSLPGYGFSDGAIRPGLSAVDIAVVFRNLMRRLGYQQFYFQGGDWGAFIGSSMATLFPEEVLGYHTNMVFSTAPIVSVVTAIGSFFPSLIVEDKYADRLYPYFTKFLPNIMQDTGYFHLQATKPDTVDSEPIGYFFNYFTYLFFIIIFGLLILTAGIKPFSIDYMYYGNSRGVALTDSPAALAAYILEKFSTGTNMEHRYLDDGGLEKYFTKDQLIDNLMLYWTTNSITTSMRLYSETINKRFLEMRMDEIPTPVPTWAIQARHELSFVPPWMMKYKYLNLVNITILDDGGHFLALEKPEIFAEDVLAAVKAFRQYHKHTKAEI